MIRTRVWFLSVMAALLVAGPAMAYSWPLLFGVPAVFGQDGVRAEKPLPPPPSFEESESEFRDLLVQVKEQPAPTRYRQLVMPYAADHLQWRQLPPVLSDYEICDPVGHCLTIWQKLWRQGRFREAYGVARSAVQAAPESVEARHALVVSQIVNETPIPNAFRALAQQHDSTDWEIGTLRSGTVPAGTLTPDLRMPLTTASCDIDLCCPMIDNPLAALFERVFGGCKETKTARCGPCPIAIGHCPEVGACAQDRKAVAMERMIERLLETPHSFHWKNAPLRQIIGDLQKTTGIRVVPDLRALRSANVSLDMPMSLSIENVKLKSALNILLSQAKLAYVIKDQVLQITSEENASRCWIPAEGLGADCGMQIVHGPQGPKMIWFVRESSGAIIPVETAFPPAPAPMVSRPAPLPPPRFAPPPIMAMPDGVVISVPVAPPQFVDNAVYSTGGPQYVVPPHPGRPTLYDPAAEPCEVAPLPVLSKNVQITQSGRHVQLSSPNYGARCERIRGGANGELILEGNVLLISRRHGQSMTINAQRVLLNVKDDQFVVEQAHGMEQSRVNIAPVSGAASGHSVLNDRDREQIFNFWVGLLR